MTFLENLINILRGTMPVPTLFGWFHLLCLAITAVAIFLAAYYGPRLKKWQVDNIVLVTAIVVIVMEVYKQLAYTFSVGDDGISTYYQWYAFPFQFCSTPMYVGLLAGIIRKGKVSDCLCAYLATFAVFAGTAVMLYPGDVFTEFAGVNIQTMVCHGSMLPIGTLLFASGRVKFSHKTILKACCVFTVTLGLACIMNEIAHLTGLLESHNFNMFYVSPYCPPSLPVYSLIQQVVPYPISLVIYIVGFTGLGTLMMVFHMPLKRYRAKVLASKD